MGKTRSARKVAEFKEKIQFSAASHKRFQTDSGEGISSSDNEELEPPLRQAICGLPSPVPSPVATQKGRPPNQLAKTFLQPTQQIQASCGKDFSSLAKSKWSEFKISTAPKVCMQLKVNKSAGNSITIMQEDLYGLDEGWGVSLAGYIAGRFPGREAIIKESAKWGVQSTCMFSSSSWMLFRFQSSEDKAKVLSKGPYSVFGRPLLLKSVDEEFDLDDAAPHTVPVWIKIFHLPLHYWTEACLSKIGTIFGTPVCADEGTTSRKRLDYARILVEVDLEHDLPNDVSITKLNGHTKTYEVEFEYMPTFCKTCKVFGHKREECMGRLSGLNRSRKDNGKTQNVNAPMGTKTDQLQPSDQSQPPKRATKEDIVKGKEKVEALHNRGLSKPHVELQHILPGTTTKKKGI